MTQLVELKEVCLSFDGRSVLDKVSFTLNKGKITTLVGPNGAGKSTLSKLVLGLLNPDSGKIIRRRDLRVGYVPQRLYLDPTLPLTVRRFLQLGKNSRLSIEEALNRVGAQDQLDNRMQKLSGGEMQRVLLARALLLQPEVLVLDEPMQGLDMQAEAELSDYLRSLPERHGCAMLMVSHDLHWVMQGTQRVVCLNRHICCTGSPQQVQQAPEYQALFGRHHVFYQHHHDHCQHEDEHHHACGPGET